jgi:hypothetical protein
MSGSPTIRRALVILALATAAFAADQQILGRRLLVKDLTGVETQRVVVVQGRQPYSTFFQFVGDPTVDGAALQIVANGPTGSTQALTLGAAGWTAIGNGFIYEGPTTGDPVRRLLIKRTDGGTTSLKAILRGRVGTTDLVVTPPNPGDDGGLVLGFPGGDRYCVSFGGAAGGTETNDDAQRWTVVKATAPAGCPVSPSITTTTTSTTLPPCGSAAAPACNGTCPAGYACEFPTATSSCVCVTGGSTGFQPCETCDTPCSGGDVCMAAIGFESGTGQLLVACGCATPPLCTNLQCLANCPAGSFCTGGGSQTNCVCRF